MVTRNTFVGFMAVEKPRLRSQSVPVTWRRSLEDEIADHSEGETAHQSEAGAARHPEAGASGVTTVMLHGVPARRGALELLEIFKDMGFGNDIDFIYLPCKKGFWGSDKKGFCIGYGFINFRSPQRLRDFAEAVHHHPLGRQQRSDDVRGFGM